MSKGRLPSLLSGSTGKPSKVTALKKCSCKRCKNEILMGQNCVDIPRTGGYSSKKRYCLNCFSKILEKSKKELTDIEKEFQT